MWNHDIGNYSGPYSTAHQQTKASQALAQAEPFIMIPGDTFKSKVVSDASMFNKNKLLFLMTIWTDSTWSLSRTIASIHSRGSDAKRFEIASQTLRKLLAKSSNVVQHVYVEI